MDTEHQIQTQILNYLKANGYYAMRLNSGAVKATNRYGNQHMMRLSPAGTPDIMAFKRDRSPTGSNLLVDNPMRLIFIEVKRPGNKPTLLQNLKMNELREHGAICIVATSMDDVAPHIV